MQSSPLNTSYLFFMFLEDDIVDIKNLMEYVYIYVCMYIYIYMVDRTTIK